MEPWERLDDCRAQTLWQWVLGNIRAAGGHFERQEPPLSISKIIISKVNCDCRSFRWCAAYGGGRRVGIGEKKIEDPEESARKQAQTAAALAEFRRENGGVDPVRSFLFFFTLLCFTFRTCCRS